jgi:transcriptional regulator with XRE-family HTH domain
MIIGERLRLLREQKKLSQGDIEKRTGLLRCYLSRVENGHTVPAIETLEKLARALDVQLYQLLYDGEEPPRQEVPASWRESGNRGWGTSGKDLRFMRKLRNLLGKMNEEDRELLMFTVQQMARKKNKTQGAAADPDLDNDADTEADTGSELDGEPGNDEGEKASAAKAAS